MDSRLPTRIQRKIEPVTESGCWIWTGAANRYGHSCLKGKAKTAHRLVYELLIGEIPEGMELMHSCDIGVCVNPNHLSVGTHNDNMKDMVKKGRSKSGRYGDEHWTRKDRNRAISIAKTNIRNAHKSGFKNNNAKVTEEMILQVRNTKNKNPDMPLAEIGSKFGIGRETARKIIRGITWKF